MGAWGELAFDNDTANDWAYGLEEVDAGGDGWRAAVADLRRRVGA